MQGSSSPSPAFRPLLVATTGAHLVDQTLMAAIPLLLAAGGASAGVIGAAVAAQAAAWLLVSLPAGALADRMSRRTILQIGGIALLTGAALAWASTSLSETSAGPLAMAGFVASAGVVLIVLSVFTLLPWFAAGHGIARANARLEFGRATVALAAPLVTAALIARGAAPTAFAFASAVAILVLLAVWRLPVEERVQTARQSMRAAIRDGAMFVAHQPVLRAIALCAIFWNFAFFALTAVLAPFALRVAGLDVEAVGRAWAIYGAGLLLGAVVAPPALRRLPTAFLFLFGPFLSLMGVAVLAVSGSVQGQWALPFGLFCVGFGPMLWLVLQTSVRQILTPPDLLGRVGATISTAIYGVRPIGALAAGLVSERWSLEAAVWLAVISFALSVLAIAWSPAARMRSLPTGPVTA